MTPDRAGTSLVETLLVASLFGFVLAGLAGFASAQGRLLGRLRDTTRAEAVVRTAAVVLDAELGYLDPADIAAVGADSIRLRAFRGGGAVCEANGSSLYVRYRGVREPNPAKDSVLVIRGSAAPGPAQPLRAAAGSDRCGGTVKLDLDTAATGGWALVFETGAYHLSGHALRYRRGGGGRQALTEALLKDGEFGLVPPFLVLDVRFDPDSLVHLVPVGGTTLRLALHGQP